MYDVNTLQTSRSAPASTAPNATRLDDAAAAALVRTADVALCVSDEAGYCIEINDAAARLLGMPRADLIGRPLAVLLGRAGPDGDDLRSGPATLRTVGRRVVLADGRTLTVTTLHALEDEQDDVIEGDSVADLCKQLSRPVRAIGNFAEIFRSRALGPLGHDRYEDFASAILAASRAIERIVDAFDQTAPTAAGFNVLEERTCSLRGLVTAALRRGRVGVGIEVAITGDDMMVRCDPDLVAHALDAMIGPAGLADRPAPREDGSPRAPGGGMAENRVQFTFHQCLGMGGFGEVYLATISRPGGLAKRMAVKRFWSFGSAWPTRWPNRWPIGCWSQPCRLLSLCG
jgi:hypothetical protein